jgi:PAT family beta-lactamase induction signal transducer AmpG
VRIQAVLVLAIMMLPLLVRERAGEKLFPWSRGRRMAPAGASVRVAGEVVAGPRGALKGPLSVLRELLRAFSVRTTAIAGLVALGLIVCEGFHDALTPAVFTQALGWSAEQYSRLQGSWGTVGRILGAIGGGYLCDRLGRRLMLGVGSGISALAFAVFGLTAALWSAPEYPLALFIVVVQGSIAMTAVSSFSLFMKISWTAAAATQFTLYMGLSNFGYAAGPLLTRFHLDDPSSYLAAAAVALLPVPFLFLLRPDSVEALKRVDQVERAEAA